VLADDVSDPRELEPRRAKLREQRTNVAPRFLEGEPGVLLLGERIRQRHC
jgi:hypothetical protein